MNHSDQRGDHDGTGVCSTSTQHEPASAKDHSSLECQLATHSVILRVSFRTRGCAAVHTRREIVQPEVACRTPPDHASSVSLSLSLSLCLSFSLYHLGFSGLLSVSRCLSSCSFCEKINIYIYIYIHIINCKNNLYTSLPHTPSLCLLSPCPSLLSLYLSLLLSLSLSFCLFLFGYLSVLALCILRSLAAASRLALPVLASPASTASTRS